MKKLLWAAGIIGAAMLSSCGDSAPEGGFKVNMNLVGLTEGDTVFLVKNSPEEQKADTFVTEKDGEIVLTGKLPDVMYCQVYVANKKKPASFPLILDNTEATVSGNLDSIDKVKITGLKCNDDAMAFQKGIMPYEMQMRQMAGMYQEAMQMKNKSLADTLEAELKKLETQEIGYILDFVSKHKDSKFSGILVFSALGQNPDYLKQGYELLDPKVQNGLYCKKLGAALKQLSAKQETAEIGRLAPDFEMENLKGEKVKLSDFKGKYVLIDCWASWCKPCREENPNVVKAYNKFKGKKFEILGVSLDDDKNAWAQAVAQDKLEWTQVSDLKKWSSLMCERYGVSAIPTNFLIDPQGMIIAKDLRGEELITKLGAILK